jgi:hypothetical protein
MGQEGKMKTRAAKDKEKSCGESLDFSSYLENILRYSASP